MPRWIAGCLALVVACGVGERNHRVAESAPLVPSTTVQDAAPSTTRPAPASTVVTTTSVAAESGIVLVFGGDVSFTHGLADRDPFGAIAALLTDADVAVVNLETAIAEPDVGTPADKEYVFRSPPVSGDLLAEAGIDVVSLANNHSLDLGAAGLARTVEILDAAEVRWVGAGVEADAYRPQVVEVGETAVGFVGVSRVLPNTSWMAGPDHIGLASAYDRHLDLVRQAITGAAASSDLVVVLVHWGTEKEPCPDELQRRLARMFVEAGADLVVGSHPHVLQGVERIGDAWVLYSTGNLAFPSAANESSRSALFRVSDGLRVELVPLDLAIGGRPSAVADAGRLTDRSLGWVDGSDGILVPGPVTCPDL